MIYFLLLIFFIIFFPIYPSIRIFDIDFLDFISLVLAYFILFLLLLLMTKKERKKTPLDLQLFFLFFWTIVSTILGIIYQNKGRYLLADFFQFSEFPIGFLLSAYIFSSEENIKKFLRGTFIISVLFAIIRFIQYYLGKVPGAHLISSGKIFVGYSGNANLLLFYLSPIFLGFCIFKKKRSLLFFFPLLLFSWLMLISWTRAFWIGLGLAFLFFSFFLNFLEKKFFLFYFSFILIGILILRFLLGGPILKEALYRFGAGLLVYFEDLSRIPSGFMSLSFRIKEIRSVFKKTIENPLKGMFGYGMGAEYFSAYSYGYQYGPTLQETSYKISYGQKHYIHSGYAKILLHQGLIGLGIFFWFLFSFFRYGIKEVKKIPSGILNGIFLGILASTFSLAILMVIANNMITHPLALLAGIGAGFLVAANRIKNLP